LENRRENTYGDTKIVTQSTIQTPLTLPCGITLKNRLAKAAMTEGLADSDGVPTAGLARLYQGWAHGGCGLLITGNVIIEPNHLERPGNVILSGKLSTEVIAKFKAWTAAGTANGTQLWAQLSHGGRQTQKLVNPTPKAPSAVKLGLPGGQFGEPEALTEAEINAVMTAFADAAKQCQELGFGGAQVHAAHGYLLSSFLNPLANQRTDRFGGSLENRAWPLLEAVRRCRAETGPSFGISVKLNSSDFQKGGLSTADSVKVAQWLEALGVDLLEVSGGNYEAPEMMGMEGIDPSAPRPEKAASTLAREAYFMSFARELRAKIKMPIMLTGGLRTRAGVQGALDEGVDVIGIARPLIVDLGAAQSLLDGKVDALPKWEDDLGNKPGFFGPKSPIKFIRMVMSFATTYWYYVQFWRHARDGKADVSVKPLAALSEITKVNKRLAAARGGPPQSAV
jgi:2,4-dienoyl-CoA reductase-like NADH-dependent reductase (Old Yellow Enzyme family)